MKADYSEQASQGVLLADIGGTNARFAILANGIVREIAHMAVVDYPSFPAALSAYLGKLPGRGLIRAAILGVPGAIQNGRCELTNNPWVIDAAELRTAYGFSAVRLLNDFEAVAWSLPRLSGDRLLQIGGRQAVEGAPLAALGPGTGLGMAANIPYGQNHLVLSSESGHSTMAGSTEREDAVIAYLRRRFGHVSSERVLSGSGLENLHEALAVLDGYISSKRRASEIVRDGVEGTCEMSRATIEMFCAMLGTVAGNLALTLGTKGGIYVAGGILRHMPSFFASSQFRARFEDKGRFRKYLEPIPVFLVLDEDVAFVGLRNLAEVEGIG